MINPIPKRFRQRYAIALSELDLRLSEAGYPHSGLIRRFVLALRHLAFIH